MFTKKKETHVVLSVEMRLRDSDRLDDLEDGRTAHDEDEQG